MFKLFHWYFQLIEGVILLIIIGVIHFIVHGLFPYVRSLLIQVSRKLYLNLFFCSSDVCKCGKSRVLGIYEKFFATFQPFKMCLKSLVTNLPLSPPLVKKIRGVVFLIVLSLNFFFAIIKQNIHFIWSKLNSWERCYWWIANHMIVSVHTILNFFRRSFI